MKTKLFFIMLFIAFGLSAQTTHNLDWHTNFLSPDTDLTIEAGDTVIWTWTSPNHTVENSAGSVETFDSGFFGPVGSTYSFTFTVVGNNPYFCGIHGAANMSGVITVTPSLSIEDETLRSFNIIENPVNQNLNINLAGNISEGKITIYDLLGKRIITKKINNSSNLSVNVSSLHNGLYLITIESENSIQTKRFIKN